MSGPHFNSVHFNRHPKLPHTLGRFVLRCIITRCTTPSFFTEPLVEGTARIPGVTVTVVSALECDATGGPPVGRNDELFLPVAVVIVTGPDTKEVPPVVSGR